MKPLCHQSTCNRNINQIIKLCEKSFFDSIIRGKLPVLIYGKPHLLAGYTALAAVSRIFKSAAEINIYRTGPLKGFTKMRDNAAAVIPIPGILRFVSQVFQHLIPRLIAMNGWKTRPLCDKLHNRIHKIPRAFLRNTHG